jgi:PKD domain-containing protein
MRPMPAARERVHLTSAALVAALVLSLLGFVATPAHADVAQVTVVSPGGAQQTLSLEALAGSEDVQGRAYALRAESGESSQTVTGFSLARILDAAGADPYGFSYLEVQRPAGGAVLLSRDQALSSGGDGPPVVYASGSGTGFLRPSAGAGDLNAGDSFTAPQGIAIVLRKGTHLKVKATASTKRTKVGKTVDFKALVEQASSGEQLRYSWYFDDGGSAAGPEASHAFAKRGSYDVVLGVTSDGSETGSSAVVTVQVGAPSEGPNRKGGGTNKSSDAPDHGVAESPEPGSSGSPVPASVGSRAQANPAQEVPLGDLIEGELVSAEAPMPPKQEQIAARTGSLDGDGGNSGGIPGAAWGILGALGLLGLGALVETRSLLP